MTKKVPLSEDNQERSVKRASATVSPKGSLTIEAALALPLFFLAVITLAFLLEILAIKTSMRSGLYNGAKKVAENGINELYLSVGALEQAIVESVGQERLARSIVKVESIRCDGSFLNKGTGMIQAKVSYELETPFLLFRPQGLRQEEEIRLKAWTGYVAFGTANDQEIVYITETGLVYHPNYHCTHLQLSIQMVASQGVASMRNEHGGKYYPCERCQGSGGAYSVYVTTHGDRYHSRLNCSGLKRTIYGVPITETTGKGRCKRCG